MPQRSCPHQGCGGRKGWPVVVIMVGEGCAAMGLGCGCVASSDCGCAVGVGCGWAVLLGCAMAAVTGFCEGTGGLRLTTFDFTALPSVAAESPPAASGVVAAIVAGGG